MRRRSSPLPLGPPSVKRRSAIARAVGALTKLVARGPSAFVRRLLPAKDSAAGPRGDVWRARTPGHGQRQCQPALRAGRRCGLGARPPPFCAARSSRVEALRWQYRARLLPRSRHHRHPGTVWSSTVLMTSRPGGERPSISGGADERPGGVCGVGQVAGAGHCPHEEGDGLKTVTSLSNLSPSRCTSRINSGACMA